MEFKEKLKERRTYEQSENAKANSSSEVKDVEEAASSEKQSIEVTDGNSKNQAEKTDVEDRPDHFQMNGEFESNMQSGDATTASDEDEAKSSKLAINNPTESKEIITASNTEPALVNGECKPDDKVMPVEKETPQN